MDYGKQLKLRVRVGWYVKGMWNCQREQKTGGEEDSPMMRIYPSMWHSRREWNSHRWDRSKRFQELTGKPSRKR